MKTDSVALAKTKSKLFLQDIRNTNNLLDVVMLLENEDSKVLTACIRGVHRIFVHLLKERAMVQSGSQGDDEPLSHEAKYIVWLEERYTDTRTKLLDLLNNNNTNVQELALCTLMKFVEEEGKSPLKKLPENHICFPSYFFGQIVKQLICCDMERSSLICRFQEFMEYDDVRYNVMKTTLQIINNRSIEDNISHLSNVLSLLENLSMPSSEPENGHLTKFLSKQPENQGLKINTYKEHRKLFTTLWLQFLKRQLKSGCVLTNNLEIEPSLVKPERLLPTSLYKKVLVILHDKVMPYMTSPLLLSDFLTQSYNIGGSISLLALNGIFILVNTYNLDYPDFYKKLYALFDPSVFHVKYRARFFFLADLFLTSTHIPAYLVAAFVKRLARLSLTAPPSGLTVLMPFIYNLLVRHPTCKILLHNTDASKELRNDPYDMEELDPAKCNALDSSLWELKSLQQHYHYTISREAKKAEQPISKMETDISDLLEVSIDSLIDQERKKKVKYVPTTFESPTGLFGNKEDQMMHFWSWTD